MADAKEQELVVESKDKVDDSTPPEIDSGLKKALDHYRKLIETKEITESQQATLEKHIKEIEGRPIIENDTDHEPSEIPVEKNKVSMGPPTLTRFEKARIMGARALQLSLGAPPFVPIPETARTSLDIAMIELEKKVIPIVIRRVLPNGDFQNIPIDYFQ